MSQIDSSESTAPRKALMAGPPRSSAGGMASVAEAILGGVNVPGTGWHCEFVDSGGGTGRLGYLKFPGALARVGRGGYDVLHLHVAMRGSTYRKGLLAQAAALRGIPYVIHLHGSGYFAFLDEAEGAVMSFVQRFYRGAAGVVVLGETWRELIIDRLGVDPSRVRIVHNGVTPVLGEPPLGDSVDAAANTAVLAMGELSLRKGTDLLASALAEVLTRDGFEDYSAVLVGTHPDAKVLAQAREVSAATQGRVAVPGPLFDADRERQFAQAAMLCLPSRKEALPMALLEAMSAGIPCITTDVGSITEIYPEGRDSGAIVLHEPDAKALAGAIAELIADPAERARIGAAGRARWQTSFTAQAMAQGIASVWDQAVASTRGH